MIKNPNEPTSSESIAVIPKHAMSLMRKHAKPGGRYHQSEIKPQLEKLKHESEAKLAKSDCQKRADKLTNSQAQELKTEHINKLQNLFDRFTRTFPSSELIKEPLWYHLPVKTRMSATPPLFQPIAPNRNPISSCLTKQGLFAVAATATTIAAAAAIVYACS